MDACWGFILSLIQKNVSDTFTEERSVLSSMDKPDSFWSWAQEIW